MFAFGAIPVSVALSGLMADYIFEPLMAGGGVVQNVVSLYTGTGEGSGIGVMFLVSGIACSVLMLASMLVKKIRDVEEIIPDYDTVASEGGADGGPAPT